MTGHNMPVLGEIALTLGASSYLEKDENFQDNILGCVEKALG